MHQNFLRPSKIVGTVIRTRSFLPQKNSVPPVFHYSSQQQLEHPTQQEPSSSKPSIGSPARLQKLIASQSDPLLAKEIFDLAAGQPNFRHSYSCYHTLILKLGRSRYFSLMRDLLSRLKSEHYAVSPALFSDVIQLYGDAHLPHEALKAFYTMLQFGCTPLPKHLNRVLEVLVARRNFLRPAFDVFRAAHRYGISPNTKSYNIMMRAFCVNGDLSIAYSLFNQMFKRDVVPDVDSYRILMQGLCRKSQVNGAVDLLEDMLNKGFVPDTLSYTTLLNSLCRKKKLKEAYKLLCRMKVKGCNPDIVHYNTVIIGFCREGRALDACKILKDMPSNGCLPNLVSYRTLVSGLCDQEMFEEAKNYMEEMALKGFSPHFSVIHALVNGLCNVGKIEEAGGVLSEMLRLGEAPHMETWVAVVSRICEEYEMARLGDIIEEALKVEMKSDTRIVEAEIGLGEYLVRKIQARSKGA
ncbi:pentatricopeptide repeat-containing protein At4g01400, mitochondrial [Malania oleifera]|uniref:pentatricopeptide repeat-containing protein At4g01400, mitochondrial n=1 Tax=Malania oleifera TaxID=397392 RepID=UPI0025AEC58D|nr:pentatricopeptide repeat-containing protein At4g01400, mitochondrial [Malania oleifera]XP_057965821.1 pentatricopeptide repeat-containing protein At4g01400, mitochondrial [Malania oleifera]XP_057965822.1 pentatricopeptide repeat-containing protein At4g01400, mitochondrial [Malania oleifera]